MVSDHSPQLAQLALMIREITMGQEIQPDLGTLLEKYSKIKLINGISEFFVSLPETRRRLLILFLYGTRNLFSYVCMNLLWRWRNSLHLFTTLGVLQNYVKQTEDLLASNLPPIDFNGETLKQCHVDLIGLTCVIVQSTGHGGICDIADAIAISIPPIFIFTAMEKWLHYSLKKAVEFSRMTDKRARNTCVHISSVWKNLHAYFMRTPPKKRKYVTMYPKGVMTKDPFKL
jgi:hypothetical protein